MFQSSLAHSTSNPSFYLYITMSSLAAARADNFYFPPEWTPQMGGISKFQGSKGANQYEQYGIIRFELPFDGWCLGCGVHMTKGLRFNAKKEKEGKYFTTQIWAFSMKCFGCEQRYKILTDPKNCTYNFAEGIRKHEQDFTPDADDSLIIATSDETRQLLTSDPMFRLQHDEEDRRRILTDRERMDLLAEIQYEHHGNLYDANSLLRDRNRKRKKRDIELHAEGASRGLSIPLLEPSQEDADRAKEVSFKKRITSSSFAHMEKQRVVNISSQSIFERPATTSAVLLRDESKMKHKHSSGAVHKSSASSSHVGKATKTTTSGNYGQCAQLLAKASALQIDPQSLKLTATAQSKPQDVGFGNVGRNSASSADTRGSHQAGGNRITGNAPVVTVRKVIAKQSEPQQSSLMDMLSEYD